MSRWSKRVLIVAGVLVSTGGLLLPQSGSGQAKGEHVIYMAAVEPKGGVTVDKEPHPTSPLPTGGGYVLKSPDSSGRWEVSVYQWSPATIVVHQGDRVTLEIVGINGAKHTGTIERYATTPFIVKRGQLTRVSFTADTPGVFRIHCDEHKPSMDGTLVVLPR